jgi:hypothetical protein
VGVSTLHVHTHPVCIDTCTVPFDRSHQEDTANTASTSHGMFVTSPRTRIQVRRGSITLLDACYAVHRTRPRVTCAVDCTATCSCRRPNRRTQCSRSTAITTRVTVVIDNDRPLAQFTHEYRYPTRERITDYVQYLTSVLLDINMYRIEMDFETDTRMASLHCCVVSMIIIGTSHHTQNAIQSRICQSPVQRTRTCMYMYYILLLLHYTYMN